MIKVENLIYQYPKTDAPTLKNLNFEIKSGEVFGFLGLSGAGKSTAQKVLYRILSGYKGKVEIEGKDLNDWNQSFFEKIGVGFELPNHYLKLTEKENLDLFASFYPSNSDRDIKALFKMVDLVDAINKPASIF